MKGRNVLEIATGPGVIAKQVAGEAKSMIATDFSEKMLAMARRGEVPENLLFEQADASRLPYEDDCFSCYDAISNRLLKFFLENEVSRPLLTHSMKTLSRSSIYKTVAMLPTKNTLTNDIHHFALSFTNVK